MATENGRSSQRSQTPFLDLWEGGEKEGREGERGKGRDTPVTPHIATTASFRRRQRELKSTISAGRLFHTFTVRQAKNGI